MNVGLLFAAVAAICNGSWSLTIKVKVVAEQQPSIAVFNLYWAIGFFVSSVLQLLSACAPADFAVNPIGILSGVILNSSIIFAFMSTQLLGVAVAAGIFCSIGVVTGFIWGTVILAQPTQSVLLCVVGIFLVLSSIGGILSASKFNSRPGYQHGLIVEPLVENAVANGDGDSISQSVDGEERESGLPDVPRVSDLTIYSSSPTSIRLSSGAIANKGAGTIFAVATGVCGGSYLVPSFYSTVDIYDNPRLLSSFIASLGIGVLLCACVTLIVFQFIGPKLEKRSSSVSAAPLKVAMFGFIGGLVYLMSTVSAFQALYNNAAVAVVSTVLQTALLVNGLWGIVLFGELRGQGIIVFFSSGLVMLTGAGLVAYAGG